MEVIRVLGVVIFVVGVIDGVTLRVVAFVVEVMVWGVIVLIQ